MEELPRLGVNARPTGTREGRVTEGQGLRELAGTLRSFNPSLRRIAQVKRQEFAEDEAARGTQEALESAKTFQEAVKSGEIEFGENPWARRAYKEQIGRNTGSRISAELETAYQSWEGKNNDDPAAIDEFVAGFIKERTEDIEDSDVLTGLQPALQTSVNNLKVSHRRFQREVVAEGYRSETANELTFAMDEMLDEDGNLSPNLWNEKVEEVKTEATTLGMPRGEFDEVIVEAVTAKAIATGDIDYLQLLDVPRKDGTPPISKKPAVAKAIASTRHTILGQKWRLESAQDTETQKIKEEVRSGARQRLIDAAFAEEGEGITPEMKEELVREFATADLPASQAVSMIRNIENLAGGGGLQDWETTEDLDRANEAAFIRGDVGAIRDMIEKDLIPANVRARYLNAADSQRRQIASDVRRQPSTSEQSEEEILANAIAQVNGQDPQDRGEDRRRGDEGEGDSNLHPTIQRINRVVDERISRGEQNIAIDRLRSEAPDLASALTNGNPNNLEPANIGLARQRITEVSKEKGMDEAVRLFAEQMNIDEASVKLLMEGSE